MNADTDLNQRLDELVEYHRAAAINYKVRADQCVEVSPTQQAANHGDVNKMIEATREFLLGQCDRHSRWIVDINNLRGVRTEEVQPGSK